MDFARRRRRNRNLDDVPNLCALYQLRDVLYYMECYIYISRRDLKLSAVCIYYMSGYNADADKV